jgi:cell shape-determining protein MreD
MLPLRLHLLPSWFPFLLCLAVLTILMNFQGSHFYQRSLTFFNVRPNFYFLVTLLMTLNLRRGAFFLPMCAGLILDLNSTANAGFYAFSYQLSMSGVLFLKRQFNLFQMPIFLILVLLSSLIKGFAETGLLGFLLGFRYSFIFLREIVLLETIYNTLLAIPVLSIFLFVDRLFNLHFTEKN